MAESYRFCGDEKTSEPGTADICRFYGTVLVHTWPTSYCSCILGAPAFIVDDDMKLNKVSPGTWKVTGQKFNAKLDIEITDCPEPAPWEEL